MASRTHREMAMAVAFASTYAKQLRDYYAKEKPGVKRIFPILERIIHDAEIQLEYFGRQIDTKDLDKVSRKVDSFNASTANEMGMKETVSFIIGQLAERICQLVEHGSTSGHIERLESVLKPMEELYEYFADVDRSHGAEEVGTELFQAWEAA